MSRYNSNDYFNDQSLASQADQARQAEMRQLTSTLARLNEKQQIATLELELAKATDPAVRARLQALLNKKMRERERQQKSATIMAVIMLFFVAGVAAFVFFWYLPSRENSSSLDPNNAAPAVSSTFSSDTDDLVQSSDSTTYAQNNEAAADQKSRQNSTATSGTITKPQFRQWVANVWNQKRSGSNNEADVLNNPKLNLVVSKDDEGYAVARISIVQSDTIDYYRINSDGQLEESNFYMNQGQTTGWTVVSTTPPPVSSVTSQAQYDHTQQNTADPQKSANAPSDQEIAQTVRNLLESKGLNREVLNSISDSEIIENTVGTVTTSQIVQTANNLTAKYPNLKN
ncbi:hypothetical protein [Enterococcus xiangfangensis]|uniref:hypothetical protein n=1 Tax=Enterococcus xiangfangensis TaxID=1296537 RepID=UPI003D185038|nr:hypothetical protein [Enterococcus asini]